MKVRELMINAGRINNDVYRLVRSLLIFKSPASHSWHYWAWCLDEEDIIYAFRFKSAKSALRYLDLLSHDNFMQTHPGSRSMFGCTKPSEKLFVAENCSEYHYCIGRNDQLELKIGYLGVGLDPWVISSKYKIAGSSSIEMMLYDSGEIRLIVNGMFNYRDLVRVITPLAMMLDVDYDTIEGLFIREGNIISGVLFDVKKVIESEEYRVYRKYGRMFKIGNIIDGFSENADADVSAKTENE
jgi:hypothetical protein